MWGGISVTFDADKLLGIIFSKKMRAKARNAKEADAGRVIELLSKETNAGYMWNTRDLVNFMLKKQEPRLDSASRGS